MRPLELQPETCAVIRRSLQAYHDQELPFGDEIAVNGHVEWCDDCAAALADLRATQSALRVFARSRSLLSNDEAATFGASVVNRLKAEQAASFLARVRSIFDDIRLVYAGLGAAAATVVCVLVMLGMMRFATRERPDSLAAIVSLLSTPLECEAGAAVADVSGCRERWERRFQRANESAEQESVFALDAVVTHLGGRLTSLQTLRAGRRASNGQAQVIEGLLDSVSRSRLEGVSTAGTSVAVNMLWMVEHATVRAAKRPPLSEPLAPKKRAAQSPAPAFWT